VLRDITEHKQLEAQFMQAQKMEAIGVLAGGVAHDFNNLLNVINGYCELVLEDLAKDNPIYNDIQQIGQAGTRAKSLTSQLLAFSRNQILQPVILDLNDIIDSTNLMLRRLIPEDIDLVIIAQPGLGLIYADPGQIQQILMNLIVNARDAMPQGGKLTIETANVDHDKGYVQSHPVVKVGSYAMLAISDNGVGMDETTKAHLFEPFFTTKGKGKGTGLGLSTVYGIVKQSNGFIWVYSEPGKGATFKIYFPRVEGNVSKLIEQTESEERIRGVETVLITEDESSVRNLVARILRERGYTVLEASNGQNALDIAREYTGEIHLAITDIIMPGMNGRDLGSRLETMRPDLKVLYVSGYTDNAIVHHGILDSGVAFLQKPFTVGDLTRKVREMLNPS
jgi:nitrogen-specific signal transduction histidine kinase/CheY-like chemotaxis protein